MPIIPNVTPVTVTATYLDANGEPLNGYVTFRPTAKLANTVNDVLVLPAPVEVDVPNGVMSVVLAASDDPQLLPNGWTYEVVENFPGSYTSYNIQLTEAMAPTVVLSSIVPSAPIIPTSQYLLRAQIGTTPGTVAAGDDPRFGIEALPVTSGLSWTGVVDLTALAATVRTIRATLTGSVTFTLPTPPANVSYTVTLVLTQDATGGRTLTLPASVLSAYGVDPALSTAGGATDVLHLMWTGAAWIALLAAPAVG